MNWLTIVVLAVIFGLTIVGYRRGFIKMVVGLIALMAAIVGTQLLEPQAEGMIRNNTGIEKEIKTAISAEMIQIIEQVAADTKENQNDAIEKLNLPEGLKKILIEKNTQDNYQKLGVTTFPDYIGAYAANVAVTAMAYVVTFIVIYLAIRILFFAINLVSKLPVLNGINHWAGALLGLVEALVYVWVFFLLVTAFMRTEWGSQAMQMVMESKTLTFLYSNNIILKFLSALIA